MKAGLAYNIGFILLILGTIGLSVNENKSAIGTGVLVSIMITGYLIGGNPRD